MNLIDEAKQALEGATPGAWVVWDGVICSQKDGGAVIALVDVSDDDARLIAFAPDMARALVLAQNLLEWVEGLLEDGCPKCGGDCSSAMPPVSYCPIRELANDIAAFRAAVERKP